MRHLLSLYNFKFFFTEQYKNQYVYVHIVPDTDKTRIAVCLVYTWNQT